MSLVSLLVVLIIACLFIWAAQFIMAAFDIPKQISAVVMVVLVIIAVLYILQTLNLTTLGPTLRLR